MRVEEGKFLMNRFKKLAIIDNIILFPEHLKALKDIADSIVWHLTADERKKMLVVPQLYLDGPACWLEIGSSKPTLNELKKIVNGADAILTCWNSIPNEIIDSSPQLEYVGFWTNLYSHRINEAHARERGIHIDYIPDYGTDAVAEFVFAGVMELARKTQKRFVETKRGEWMYENLKTGSKVIVEPNQIEEWILSGKRLGIVGLGRIGKRVAEIGKFGFNMEVAYFSRTRKPEAESLGMKFMPLEEMFSWADIVSSHLSPDAPEKLVSKPLLERLHSRALFINTGSGHSVDQEALIELLKQNRFSAFLDVYEGLPPRKELKDLPNVLFTYRAAWFTQQSIAYKAEQLLSKMRKYLEGKKQGHEISYRTATGI